MLVTSLSASLNFQNPPVTPPSSQPSALTLLLTETTGQGWQSCWVGGSHQGWLTVSSLAQSDLSGCVKSWLLLCCWLWWRWLERTHGRGLMTDWGHQRVSSLEANNNSLAGLYRKTRITTIMTTHRLSLPSLLPHQTHSRPQRAGWCWKGWAWWWPPGKVMLAPFIICCRRGRSVKAMIVL